MRTSPSTARIVTTAAALLPLALTLSAPAQAAGIPGGTVDVRVVKIVDGDTVDVMRGATKVRVQLLGVDTPERGRCWSKAATARTAALLPPGTTARLLTGRTDRIGRLPLHVWSAKGVHVNRNLIRYGYGKAVPSTPADKYTTLFRAEQAKAKADKLRIWSGRCDTTSSTPAPSPTPTAPPAGTDPRFRTCAEANAAGYGPYRRGVDPEYAWYQDRDGDGVVCER
ncbi:excalibur calcium-binding domain-containing protein [Nonomuraea sp. NPDC049607]|uniref:thermonuclease family protein n=1 Tax=Nonomuraea sp. NPDC049607 TaxID=3154732 RepID=UPI00343385E9